MASTEAGIEQIIEIPENEEIGEIISDDSTPSFQKFRYKAYPDKYISPGSVVALKIDENKFLVGRVTASHEINPNFSPEKVAVRHAMGITPEHPGEELSITVFRVYEVEIVDQVFSENGKYKIYPPESLPKSGSKVIIPPKNMISEVLGIKNDKNEGLYLGTLATTISSESEIPVILNKEVIQRHVFIGGTTGGGKSYATRVLAEEIHKHKLPIIFFDTQDEFTPLTQKLGGTILRPGKDYFIKLSSLSEDEVLELVPSLHHPTHLEVLSSAFIRCKESGREFTIDELITTVTTICQENAMSPSTQRIVTTRVGSYLRGYNFIGNQFNWSDLLKKSNIIDINCKGVSRQRLQLILASTLRELLNLRLGKKIPPYIMFIDEAHLFVPEGEDSACKQIIRENVRMGRHNGICMALITQSPLDIDKKAIRQCNTRFLFALEQDQLSALQGVRSDASQEMIDRLPKSPVGTCILSGTYETIKHAIPLRIREMETKDADSGKSPPIFEEIKGLYQ